MERASRLARGTDIGRYVVLDRIGRGGMGVVYAAYDSDLDRKVAVKFLHSDRPGDGARETRLMREAQAMARLSHPNVIAVYEVGGFEDQIFLAMEFVDGLDLRRWLEAEERTPAEILGVFRAAGQGLAAAHAAGLVHRDFKPGNVLVDKQNRPRVTDFGICRAARRGDGREPAAAELKERDQPAATGTNLLAAELTRTGEVQGTPRYMAPEQHRSGDADERSDQFAFCVALYEALYRGHPFRGRDLAELVDNALSGRVHRPPAQPSVPRSCRSAILRGLSTLPEERFPSMNALLAALEPSRPRGRLALALAGALTAGLFAVGFALEPDPDEDRCTGGRAQIASVWDEAASAGIATEFAASGRAHAGSSAARVVERLDDYAGRWAAMHRATCQATWRGEQSAELLDRRMACLDRHLGQVSVLIDLFLHRADGAVVDKAIDLVAALEPLSVCADSATLLSRAAQPADPRVRARLAELERQVDRAELERQAGRPQAAADAARPLLAADQPGDDPRLAARAGRVFGRALEDLGRPAEAREALLRAHGLATRAGDLRLAIHIRIDLLLVVGARQMRAGEAELMERLTEADLERAELRDDPDTRALRLAALARVAIEERRGPRAAQLQREVLAIRRSSSPRLSEEVAGAEETLGLALAEEGEHEEARSHYMEALAIRRHLVGDDHPLAANVLINLGVSYLDEANTVDGRKHLLAALAILERMPEYRTYPTVLTNLGALESLDANYERARHYYETALAMNLRVLGPKHMSVARSLGSIAIALRETGDLEQAIDHHRRALAIHEQNGSTDTVDYARLLSSFGEDLRQLGRAAESLKNQERALEISRAQSSIRNSRILLCKGLALLDLGRHRDAVEPLEEALEGFGETGLAGARVAFGLARALEPDRPRSPRARQLAEGALELFTDKRHARERDEVAAYLARGRVRRDVGFSRLRR